MSQNPSIASTSTPYSTLPPALLSLHTAKARSKLTFADLAAKVGKDEVWVAAAFYGQARPSPDELAQLADALGVQEEGKAALVGELGEHWWPQRGLGPVPPTDPVIYRLFEGVLVYGQAIKAIIHEKFGDGIMSMIDCKVHVEKKPDPKGDRVILTFDGKFLPYIKW